MPKNVEMSQTIYQTTNGEICQTISPFEESMTNVARPIIHPLFVYLLPGFVWILKHRLTDQRLSA